MRPADGIMIVRQWSTQIVNLREQKWQVFLNAIASGGDLVGRPLQRSFGTGAIVPHHKDNERIVSLAGLLHLIQYPANLIVGIRESAGIKFHHTRIETLLICTE